MAENINQKNIITLARNTPVALVVGVAGFIGSSLSDQLLKRGIQVVGIDNFSTGKRQNLVNSIKDKNFHLLNISADQLELDLARTDYIFVVAGSGWNLTPLLNIAKKYNSKIVFVSSIELYSKKIEGNLKWYRKAETELAGYAKEHKLNARLVRLSAVYGPRMRFEIEDPAVTLIQAALLDQLQKTSITSDFISRSIYIDDAVGLIIKSMLKGSTALKIFDGGLLTPIKISEIKQVLLDPLWYENRGFTPSELPPWPTPNLEKTIKELSWSSDTGLVRGLKNTLSFFKDNEVEVPELDEKKEIEETVSPEKILPKSKIHPLDYRAHLPNEEIGVEEKKDTKKMKISFFTILALFLISYALILPFLSLGFGILTFKHNLNQAFVFLSKGEFDKSQQSLQSAKYALDQVDFLLRSIESIKKTNLFIPQFKVVEDIVKITNLTLDSAQTSIEGTRLLYESLKAVTGENTASPKEFLEKAQVEFAQADEKSSRAYAMLNNSAFEDSLPAILKDRLVGVEGKLVGFIKLLKKGRTVSAISPSLVGLGTKKSYLILFQNNGELRPTGGFIGSYAEVTFEDGKLKGLEVNDVYAADGQLKLHIEPPKEIKEDLGQKDWFLRDSNFEPDFATAARQAEWFYTKETAKRVDGVIALDISAMEGLLTVIGPLDLADYNEKITANNLFEKSVTNAESGFFPGSQAKKNFLTALTTQLLNKMFFLPNQNWPAIASSLDESLEEKHLLLYLSDPKLFSYLVSQNWAGALPRQSEDKNGELTDFLASIEANFGANKANYYLERNYLLETEIGMEGEIFQKLKINYTNRSPSEVWPSGKYKNRLRVYLPFGSKLKKALWGEADITSRFSAFVDYGRTGYSTLLELLPKESKSLVLEYTPGKGLTFKDMQAIYKINILKQPGTLKDPFEWKLTYPLNYKLKSQIGKNIGPQEHNIITDLSTDKSFEVKFSR